MSVQSRKFTSSNRDALPNRNDQDELIQAPCQVCLSMSSNLAGIGNCSHVCIQVDSNIARE